MCLKTRFELRVVGVRDVVIVRNGMRRCLSGIAVIYHRFQCCQTQVYIIYAGTSATGNS